MELPRWGHRSAASCGCAAGHSTVHGGNETPDRNGFLSGDDARHDASSLLDFYVASGGAVGSKQERYDGGPVAREARSVLAKVGTDPSECSGAVDRQTGEPCSSKRVVAALEQFVRAVPHPPAAPPPAAETLPPSQSADAQTVRLAAQVLGCGSESCVVTHPRFREFVRENGGGLESAGGVRLLDIELGRRFKTEGPRDSTQLLSNFNIDGVLQEWAAEFPAFFNFGFNMMDFERVGGSLARVDPAGILSGTEAQNLGKMGGLVKRPCNTFACVLNTDVSTGRGRHWVAVFGDCRGRGDWSVEYFNSAGNPPPAPVTRWLESTAARLAGYRAARPQEYGAGAVSALPLTDIRHQNSQTECGLYALYYIRRRLEGAPPSEFREARIPDEAMVEFRKHVFRAT